MERPNFLIVVVDSAQLDAYAVNGGQARAPHVERLACEGARFTNAYTVSPICHPARASIFTGLFPRAHGVITNAQVHGWYPFKILEGVKTYAEVLSEAGYRCGYAGQWHVQDVRGFHDNRAIPTRQHLQALQARGLSEQCVPERTFKGCGRLRIGLEDTREAGFARSALELLEEYARLNQPWLIHCDFDGPHPPCHIPAPYDTLYDPAAMRLPASRHDPLEDRPYVHRLNRQRQGTASWSDEDWRQVLAHYYGNITMLDDLFGRLLTRLDELGLSQKTAVVFTSDHGCLMGAHGFLTHGTPAMFEEALRVPLFVKWPGRTRGQTVCEEFVSHVDLLPTLAEMAGASPPQKMHGRSLVPLLEGARPKDWRSQICATYDGDGFAFYSNRAIRTREGKLVYHAFGEHELYEFVSDAGEQRNRFADPTCAGLKSALIPRLATWLKEVEDPLFGAVRRDFGLR